MKKVFAATLFLSLLMLILAACQGPIDTVVGSSTHIPAATPQQSSAYIPAATPQQSTPQAAIYDAQVVSVEVRYGTMDITQPHAFVRGNIDGSCTTLLEPQVSFSTDTFYIKLQASSPSDRSCIQLIRPFEKAISLDVTNLAPGNYTVVANGVSAILTIYSEPSRPIVNTLELLYYDSNHNIQMVSPSFPADIVLDPYFNELIPVAGVANSTAYLLDSTNGTKAIAVNKNGVGELNFIGRPTSVGLAVFPGTADSQARLAWGTEYSQKYPNSTIEISNLDGSGAETLLTQEVTEPLVTLMPEFWSADGHALYFSKEPVGIGGYILYGGASNLYRIDINTKEVTELIPQAPSDGPQVCLDSISSDYRYVAEHCSGDFIRIRDLSSGGTANIPLPENLPAGDKQLGSARFSRDGAQIAYAVAEGDPNNVQGWMVVSDIATSNSKVILTSSKGSYYTIAGWLNGETLLVQSTNMLDCSPYCTGELWIVNIDGTGAQKVADGTFVTAIPYGSIPGPLPTPLPVPTTTACKDEAEYITDDGTDGTYYDPNTAFTKTWTVKNSGTCTWTSKYLVFQISGAFMTQQPGYWLLPEGQTVKPGQDIDIQVGMTSPPEKGFYESYWGLKNEAGEILPIKGGANGNSFYTKINVGKDLGGNNGGAVTATAIDIIPEQGSGDACTADSTYFVHAYISTDGPATVSYEIGSTAGQIAAGYFEVDGDQTPYVRATLEFDRADTKTINLRFVGPYPYPDDISVMLRVNGGDWVATKLFCP